jgi:hypothetical protein
MPLFPTAHSVLPLPREQPAKIASQHPRAVLDFDTCHLPISAERRTDPSNLRES